jgi:hypothetical protein
MILFIVYLFLFLGLILINNDINIPRTYIGLLLFFLIKLLFNYRKCTISYIECKLRKVKKEQGYLNRFLDSIIDLRYTPHIYVMYFISAIIIYYYFIVRKNNINSGN